MLWHSGILDGQPRRKDLRELAILALTPGIPFLWVMHAGRLNHVYRCFLEREIASFNEHDLPQVNAASITEADAFAMLKVTRANYRGAVPLYAQLWLKATPRTDKDVAKELGVDHRKVQRWRTRTYFDPLTGVPTR